MGHLHELGQAFSVWSREVRKADYRTRGHPDRRRGDPQTRRNDLIARFLSDPTNDERRRWVAAQRERTEVPDDLIIVRTDLDSARFLVLIRLERQSLRA